MKTAQRVSESSPLEPQIVQNEEHIVRHIHDPNAPLSAESLRELEALAQMPDSEIDYSDIPALTDEQLKEFVHGPWTPLAERTVTLRIDDEVFEWLTKQGRTHAFLVNLLLKREAQRGREREHQVESSPAGSPPISKAS